jgi:hypothetical protein
MKAISFLLFILITLASLCGGVTFWNLQTQVKGPDRTIDAYPLSDSNQDSVLAQISDPKYKDNPAVKDRYFLQGYGIDEEWLRHGTLRRKPMSGEKIAELRKTYEISQW